MHHIDVVLFKKKRKEFYSNLIELIKNWLSIVWTTIDNEFFQVKIIKMIKKYDFDGN